MVRPRPEGKNVGEIQVLRDKKSACLLSLAPYDGVLLAGQSLIDNRVDVMPVVCQNVHKPRRQILVQLYSHGTAGALVTGRSS